MKIAVTSQDYLSITGHAGKATRFLVFDAEPDRDPVEIARVELSDDQTVHNLQDGPHPLDGLDVLIVGSAGQCFIERMLARGITTVAARGISPADAVAAYVAGLLRPLTEAESCECGH